MPWHSLGLFVLRGLTFSIGCLGLVWGIFVLPQSEAAEDFRDLESRLLRFETFGPATFTRTLESQASQDLSACDTHSQRAMLLMQMALAQTALRSGVVNEFDWHAKSVEARSIRILSCSSRQSFVWLVLFDLEVLHGVLNEHSFDLLAMSYETSPNEGWISIRRILVAMPLILTAPEPVRQRILNEFQLLIRYGFTDVAAVAYLRAPTLARSLLETGVRQLDVSKQRKFSDELQTLQKLRS
jgi:hypothetical protein